MRRLGTWAIAVATGCASQTAQPPPPADAGDPCAFSAEWIDRASACTCYVRLLTDRANGLHCMLTPEPACPAVLDQFEQKSGVAGRCMRYKVAALQACRTTVADYATCDDFSQKPCLLAITEDRTGKACPHGDAGPNDADAASDAAIDTADTLPPGDVAAEGG